MALPLDNRQIEDIASTTVDQRLPTIADNFFTGSPLFVRLRSRHNVVLDGGDKVRQTLIYQGLPGGSYGVGDNFDTSRRNILEQLIFNWKRYYVNITVEGLEDLQNAGASRVIDLVSTKLDVAELDMIQNVGGDLFGQGGGNLLTGLRAAVDNGDLVSSYGGITRSSTAAEGKAVRGNVDTTGGVFSLALMNSTMMGTGTGPAIGREKPDLIVTTQTIFNKWWERSQPSERNSGGEDLRKIGFDTIRFNGADVVVDPQVPSGQVYFLNTKFVKLVIHKMRNFTFRGWFNTSNRDERVGQVLWAGELVVPSPRMQAFVSSVT
ncbi:MAG: phage major capsid protein [Acidiferrobacterales bacterium]